MPALRVVLALAAATAAAIVLRCPASAAPTIVAADPTRTSAIALSDASTTVTKAGATDFSHVLCLAFVNHGPRTATKVGFSLANVDATGTVLGVDTLYPTGKFLVERRSAFSGGSRFIAVSPNGNCHDTVVEHRPVRSALDFKPSRREPDVAVAAVLVSVREIVYDDGTAWRSDDVPKTGDHLPLPSPPPFVAAVPAGLPVVTAATVPGSPFEVADAYGLAETGSPGGPPFGFSRYACAQFAMRDPRAVKRMEFGVELVDRNGIIAMTNSVDSFTLRQGLIATCAELFGKFDADTFVYEWPGHSLPLGRVVVVPVFAQFADGTSWRSPTPPKIGDPPTPPP